MGCAIEIRNSEYLSDAESLGQTSMDEIFYRRLRELVRVHDLMFQRLLFERPMDAVVLADLFRDVGKTCLKIAEAMHKNKKDREQGDQY